MVLRARKVLLTQSRGTHDIHSKWLPAGTHNFNIKHYTDYTVKGIIYGFDFNAHYEFEYEEFIKMMAKAQNKISHKGNVRLDCTSFHPRPNYRPVRRRDPPPDACPICLETCCNNRHITRCGHIFHDTCIRRWEQGGHESCPMCRTRLTL